MGLKDSLTSYYKLDESSGNAADAHGSNTLTNNGTMTYTTGKINNGASVSGGTKYLSRTSAILSATNNISVSFWVNIPDTSELGGFLRIGSAGAADGWGVGVGNTQYDNLGNNLIILIDGVAWRSFGALGTGWKHVVLTRGATTWKAYINNSLSGSTFTDSPNTPAAESYIGKDQADWTGVIDEVGYWNRELTSTEVSELYNSGNALSYDDFTGGGGGAVAPTPTLLMMGV